MKMVDDVHNGVTFCSGSYGTNLENDLPDMIRSLKEEYILRTSEILNLIHRPILRRRHTCRPTVRLICTK